MKVPYFPKDEMPSAVDDAADTISQYHKVEIPSKKEQAKSHEALMKKYRKIWKEKDCIHWKDNEDK
tara:strand:- start:100 stop:297 length:198 start_codon:yes stop_codon:yes gene_type:complete